MNRHGEMLKELKKEKAQQAKKQKEVEAHREEVTMPCFLYAYRVCCRRRGSLECTREGERMMDAAAVQ